MGHFQIVGPKTVEETLNFLAQAEGNVAFLSGGTDFIIDLREKGIQYDLVIDLSQVGELNYIKEEAGWVKIGAATPFTQIGRNPLMEHRARCLAQAARQMGSEQIRNRGTIGGNLASAAPAGDSIPVLMALEAVIGTMGPREKRIIPVEGFITGAGSTCLEEKELITEISFPVLEDSFISGFEKVGSRTAVSIARLSLAAVIEYDRHAQRIAQARLAAGAIGPKAFRLKEVEDFLSGKKVDEDFLCRFALHLQDAVDRAIPGRHSQKYKREAMRGLAEDLMQNLFSRIISHCPHPAPTRNG